MAFPSRVTSTSKVAFDRATSKTSWDIPKTLCTKKNGTVRIAGHSLYVGLRFKNRSLYSNITNNHVEFFTEHDEELLFSFPLPIRLYYRPAGNFININYVIGMWQRQPPVLAPALSKPRPKRRQ